MIWPDEAFSHLHPQQDTRRDEGRQGRRWVGGAWWLSGSGWPPPSKDACGSGAWEWFDALLQN